MLVVGMQENVNDFRTTFVFQANAYNGQATGEIEEAKLIL